MTELHGVLPVLSTPFTESDDIDRPALIKETEWLLAAGVDGLVIAMVSEILRLDPGERMALVETTIAAVAGRRPVVVSVGAESTAQSVRLALHAVDAGAAAVMANPPVSTRPTEAELRKHFETVADATGPVPLIVQDASGYVGQAVPLGLMTSLLERFGERKIRFKPEAEPLGPQLSALIGATGGRARVFEGSGGRSLLDSHRRGVIGTMPGSDLAWAMVSLWRALEEGDSSRAYGIQAALAPILTFVSSLDSYVRVEKHLLRIQGVFDNERQRGPTDFILDGQSCRELAILLGRLVTACGRDAAISTRDLQQVA
ncbi:MAG: dihydrodipicolinate synthase family protein [Bifidobacteriaceae bacterium]|jgi:4-hydroxy-tetrahydrodipicolinate synthase|nr:dihydrodipicolinate synthase family protein [Bifidobacteriaceae bacterium]